MFRGTQCPAGRLALPEYTAPGREQRRRPGLTQPSTAQWSSVQADQRNGLGSAGVGATHLSGVKRQLEALEGAQGTQQEAAVSLGVAGRHFCSGPDRVLLGDLEQSCPGSHGKALPLTPTTRPSSPGSGNVAPETKVTLR